MQIGRPSFYMPAFTRPIHKTPFYGQKRTSQIRLPVRNFAVFTDGIHQICLSVRNFAVFTDGAVQEGAHSEISKVYRKKLLDEYIKRHY